ncbi:MAG: diguanylate cyclase domain-containing protein [Burkholderiales bacterium]
MPIFERLRRLNARMGIKARLWLLVLALGLPFLLYLLIIASEQADRMRAYAKERNLAVARLAAARVDDYVGDIKQLLATLSETVSVGAGAGEQNETLLQHLKRDLPDYINNVAVWDLDGDSLGSLDPRTRMNRINIADRQYFRDVLVDGGLAVEAPMVTRTSRELVVQFARAVMRDGHPVGVVTASTKLLPIQQLLIPKGGLPPGSVVDVIDRNGVVLARSEDPEAWIGKTMPLEAEVVDSVRQQEGTREFAGADGEARLAGYSTARNVPWLVHVGIPAATALAPVRADLHRNLGLGMVMLLVALLFAAMIAEKIARPLRQLAVDAKTLGAGNLVHRSNVQSGGETAYLARTLNRMAQALQDRSTALSRSEQRLRLITDNMPVLISYADRDERYRFANAFNYDLLGVKPSDMIGKTIRECRGEAAYAEIKCRIDEVLGGMPVSFEVRHPMPGGTRDLSLTYLPDYDDANQIVGFYIMGLDVTERRKLEGQLSRMAQYDQLTGLPNRYLLNDRLEQACARSLRDGQQLAVLYLDLDYFKAINDTYGHGAGDVVLKEFGRRLVSSLRASDTVARLGGDEFIVLIEGFLSYRHLETIARKIIDTVAMPIHVDDSGDSAVTISTSIGIATLPPCGTAEEVMHVADAAMFDAKAGGGARFVIAPVKAAQAAAAAAKR